MKELLLLTTLIFFCTVCEAQTPAKASVKDAKDRYANTELQYTATTSLPEGTVFSNGKVMLMKGYKTVNLDSNRIIIVQKPNGETSGAFKCSCETGSGSCGVSTDGTASIHCVAFGGCNCMMAMVVKPPKGVAITQSNGDWKKLVLPSANSQQQKTEDPDQGGEVTNKKKTQLPVKQ